MQPTSLDAFLKNPTPATALDVLIYLRGLRDYEQIIKLAPVFCALFPHDNASILNELSNAYYYTDQFENAAELCTAVLNKVIPFDFANMVRHNMTFSLNKLNSPHSTYDPQLVANVEKNQIPYLTLSITSCKRFDLFQRTINSFLKCVRDRYLISEYICVDDNSSDEDRDKMVKMYPFFTFYFKTAEEKGHPQSMNIIKRLCKTKYLLHMEDDWEFLYADNFISKCIHVLTNAPKEQKIKQCLFNKNYGELPDCLHRIVGGEFHVTPINGSSSGGVRYYIHEHLSTNDFVKKHGPHANCAYWPHFSFRPSVIDTSIFTDIGDFDEKSDHFEMNYAYRYVAKGYKSAFLEGICCKHIGRLTSERHDQTALNAYALNGQNQFGVQNFVKEQPEYKTFVVNMDRRADRWESFMQKAELIGLKNYTRFAAIDGNTLTSTRQLRRLFDPNDYHWTRGVIGCALSHMKLWIELLHSDDEAYIILEDDIRFDKDYCNKVKLARASNTNWDVIFLGTSRRQQQVASAPMKIVRKNLAECFKYTFGGTIGYIIKKTAVPKLLDFVNYHGMIHAIDTMMLKSANITNICFCEPSIIFSEMANAGGDSDIQHGYNDPSTYLECDYDQRLCEEKETFGKVNVINNTQELDPQVVNFMWSPGEDVDGYVWYPVNKCSLYIHEDLLMDDEVRSKFLVDRVKINGKYTIEDAIKYTN